MPERYIKVVEPDTDNVATMLRDAEEGETLEVEVSSEIQEVTLEEDIPFGHKVALYDIESGDTIYKYGVSIGYASTDIAPGTWVHVQNVESNYGRGDLAEDQAIDSVS